MSAYAGQLTPRVVPETTNESIERSKPIKPLPTDRISPPNQINILRAWVLASANGTKAATVNEVAKIVEMAASTVAMTNPFFSSLGLIQRLAVGTYIPCEDVIAFFTADDQHSGPNRLSRALRRAWFSQILVPRLARAPLQEDAALSLLEEASTAGPENRKALGFVLDLMVYAEIMERSEGKLRLLSTGGAESVDTSVVFDLNGEAARYRVNINVDTKDLGTWSAEQIAAFFRGLAELATATSNQNQ